MAKTPINPRRPAANHGGKTTCESVGFAEVEFPLPIRPRLVIEFSDGLSLLLEDESAIELAAAFIDAFRRSEAAHKNNKDTKGGKR